MLQEGGSFRCSSNVHRFLTLLVGAALSVTQLRRLAQGQIFLSSFSHFTPPEHFIKRR
jgi:hypothetical protein